MRAGRNLPQTDESAGKNRLTQGCPKFLSHPFQKTKQTVMPSSAAFSISNSSVKHLLQVLFFAYHAYCMMLISKLLFHDGGRENCQTSHSKIFNNASSDWEIHNVPFTSFVMFQIKFRGNVFWFFLNE